MSQQFALWMIHLYERERCKSHRFGVVCEEQSTVCRFVSLGIPDEPICNGNQLNVFAHYGIRKGGITKAVLAANRVKEYICGLKECI